MKGTLYLVATPIGNRADMSFRALDVLRTVDLVVCEERREGEKLLGHFGISRPLEHLNEHNEAAAAFHILQHLNSGKSAALISDAGTPVFSDPGRLLVGKAIGDGIRIVPVPGASSLLPALTVSGFPIDRFLFYGWLSPKKERRRGELRRLQQEKQTIVLMDTPYRMLALLRDLAEAFGDRRRMCIAYNLTMPDEQIFHGTAEALHREASRLRLKGEFVIVIEGTEIGGVAGSKVRLKTLGRRLGKS
jgi:16S rRNA (cytidine1402-2'-O)-methyltransferase